MKILITGASGYVGARMFADLLGHYDVVGTFQGHKLFGGLLKLDIANREDVFKMVSKIHPNLIIHAAAISSRRLCEERPQEAFALYLESRVYSSIKGFAVHVDIPHRSNRALDALRTC